MEPLAPESATASPVSEAETLSLLERGLHESALQALRELRPADGARVLARLEPIKRVALIERLGPSVAAGLLEHLPVRDAAATASSLNGSFLPALLDELRPDVAADILRCFPPERRHETLAAMGRARDVSPLLRYEDKSAGGLMVPDFVVLREWMSVEEAIDYLRGSNSLAEASSSLFVLDRHNALTGVINLRDLVAAPAAARVRDLMKNHTITVGPKTHQEECARLMAHYNLAQLPVVDEKRGMIGVILSEDIIDVVEAEAEEDMLRLAGIAEPERVLSPVQRSFRTRLPWLLVNLGTLVLAALVIDAFEATIAEAAFLAAFLPIVANQCGIAGTQTLTLVTRGLALGELTWTNAARALRREVLLGVVNGVVFGLIAGGIAYVWKTDPLLGLVVGVAMVLNMVLAGLVGALVPLALKAFRQDPALGAAVIVSTATDIAGFGLILGLATWWLA